VSYYICSQVTGKKVPYIICYYTGEGGEKYRGRGEGMVGLKQNSKYGILPRFGIFTTGFKK